MKRRRHPLSARSGLAPGTQLALNEVRDGTVRHASQQTADPVASLYGCLKAHPRDPLAELVAEHAAEIETDEHWLRGR